MSKIIKFFKNMRPEFLVALFFFLIVLGYTAYTFISDIFFENNSPSFVTSKGGGKPSNISEAVSAERPVIVSTGERKKVFNSMMKQMPELKGVELTAEVENPAVWIYMGSDGSRRDNLASDYCKWLHNNGVMASSVTILDSAARSKGKIVETGESRCM